MTRRRSATSFVPRDWMVDAADLVLDTTALSVAAVAERVLTAFLAAQ